MFTEANVYYEEEIKELTKDTNFEMAGDIAAKIGNNKLANELYLRMLNEKDLLPSEVLILAHKIGDESLAAEFLDRMLASDRNIEDWTIEAYRHRIYNLAEVGKKELAIQYLSLFLANLENNNHQISKDIRPFELLDIVRIAGQLGLNDVVKKLLTKTYEISKRGLYFNDAKEIATKLSKKDEARIYHGLYVLYYSSISRSSKLNILACQDGARFRKDSY